MNPFEKHLVNKKNRILREIGPSSTLASLFGALSRDYDVVFLDHFHEYQKAKGNAGKINLEQTAGAEFPNSDIIGISMMTSTRKASLDLIRLAKDISNAKIIIGGAHTTVIPEQVLQHYPMDFMVFGEAEKTFPELVNAIDDGNDLRQVKGIFYKQGNIKEKSYSNLV